MINNQAKVDAFEAYLAAKTLYLFFLTDDYANIEANPEDSTVTANDFSGDVVTTSTLNPNYFEIDFSAGSVNNTSDSVVFSNDQVDNIDVVSGSPTEVTVDGYIITDGTNLATAQLVAVDNFTGAAVTMGDTAEESFVLPAGAITITVA